MPRCFQYVILIILVITFAACDDEDGAPVHSNDVSMSFSGHGYDDLFAEYPITMHPTPQSYSRENFTYKWQMGDGTESTEVNPTHTYTTPGVYTIRLTVSAKRYRDSTITIHPKPLLLGETISHDDGKFIYQDKNGNYQILFSKDSDWKLVNLSVDYKTLSTKSLLLDASRTLSTMFINKNGNLIGLDESLWEIDVEGNIVMEKYAWVPGIIPPNLIEGNNEYYYVGGGNDITVLRHVNGEGDAISVQPIGNSKGWTAVNGEFEMPDMARIHYLNSNGNQVLWKGKISGETIFEKEFEGSRRSRSFKVQGGYLCIGLLIDDLDSYHFYVYTMMNDQGEIIWTTYNPWPTYDTYWEQFPVQVISTEGFVYVFYGNMHGVKLDSNGNIVWLKRFTFPDDRFKAVTINDKQNFVLLGTHLYDFNGDAYVDDRGDVIVLEINPDGNIVD